MFASFVISLLGLMSGAGGAQGTAELAQTVTARWVAEPFVALVDDLERDEGWRSRFEEAVATELRLPPGVRFELSDLDLHAHAETLAAVGRLTFEGESPIWLQFQLALSLDWALLGNASLIADQPRSTFARQQQAGLLYYRWETFTDVVQALTQCVALVRDRTEEIVFLEVTTGETFGPRPFLRVSSKLVLNPAGDSSARTDSVVLSLYAILPLPASSAQGTERGTDDHLRRAGGGRAISEVTTMWTIDEALDRAISAATDLHRLPGRSRGISTSPRRDAMTFDQCIPTAGGRDALFSLGMDRSAAESPWVHWSQFRLELERTRFILDFAKRFADAHRQQLALAAVFPGANSSMRCTIVVATTPIYDHHLEARTARVLLFDVPDDASPIQVRRPIEAKVHCEESLGVYLWTATLNDGRTFSVEREYVFMCGSGVTWPPEATFDGRAGVLVGGTTFTVCEPE